MQKRKEFFQYMESAYQGAMSGEGSAGGHRIDSYYAGYSQVESEVEGGVSSVTIPEFSLRIMPMQANQGKINWRVLLLKYRYGICFSILDTNQHTVIAYCT